MKPVFMLAALFLFAVLPAGAVPTKKPAAKKPPQMLAVPLAAAQTVQVTETVAGASGGSESLGAPVTITVVVQRPSQFHIEETGKDGAPAHALVSDAKTLVFYDGARKEYRKQDAPQGEWPGPVREVMSLPAKVPVTPATLNGTPRLLFLVPSSGGQPALTRKFWLDAKTGLPVRESLYVGTHEAERIDFSHWVLNQPIPASQFAFVPPADAKEHVDPPAPVLLANGVAAPDFTVQDKDGKPVKLSDYKGKVVVLDFWATWCGPCQQSLPHTQAVAKQFAAQGVTVLAVNVSDSKDAFLKWLPQHPEYDAITFAIDPSPPDKSVAATLYGVDGIPTQYVISKDGKIATHFVGYNGPTDDLANAVTAALKG